jgi:hypothetical protein
VSRLPFLRSLNVVAAWRADVETAGADLEASGLQAAVLAVHAFAWRLSAVTLPLAVVVTARFVADGDAQPVTLLFAAGAGIVAPQWAAFLLTFPIAGSAALLTWHHRRPQSREARLRFGITGLVYPYYGWRYAYRGRRRPWGAMTREEKMRSNPKRAGVRTSADSADRLRSE